VCRSPHPPSPLHLTRLKCHLHLLRCNGVTQGQKSLALRPQVGSRLTPHHKMSSSNSGRNPKAPAFSPIVDDLEDELSLPFRGFTSGGSGSITPIPRSATPKRARTNTSPPPPSPPAPADTDWAKEYRDHRTKVVGAAESHANNWNPNSFGAILSKLEKYHLDTVQPLFESVRFLLGELTSLKSEVAAFHSVVDVITPAPFTPSASAAPRAPAAQAPRPSAPPPPPAASAPSWATVAKRSRRNKTGIPNLTPIITNTATVASKARQPKGQQTSNNNNSPSTRSRRLIVKRDGTDLNLTPVQLRDALNKALGFTAILSAQVSRSPAAGNTGNVSLTLMENLPATKLYAKVGEHLSTIPGATSLHLDSPIVQMVVHGIPTSLPLESLQQELITYNPGLALASPPRWLTKPDQRQGKSASSVVISLSGNKAQDVASRPRLFAFSATLRTERKLRFGPSTQCAKCQRFGHHTTKCEYPACCRWCAGPHLTGAHSCPTSTCSTNGRPCSHTLTRCALCAGPHESHFKDCPSRVAPTVGDDMDVNA
jgi:hypothetical protein